MVITATAQPEHRYTDYQCAHFILRCMISRSSILRADRMTLRATTTGRTHIFLAPRL